MAVKIKENITRREFVKKVVGTACACTLISLDTITAAPPDKSEIKDKLVAPCGLYCGACPMYLSTQDKEKVTQENMQCDGCIGGGRVAVFCRMCKMRECAEKKQKVTRCADCKEFPCSEITRFNNDGMLHHAEVLSNSRQIQEVGITEWTKREEERWSCPQCHAKISWYDQKCSSCGAKRSDKLFSLKRE